MITNAFFGKQANFISNNSINSGMNFNEIENYQLPQFSEPVYKVNLTAPPRYINNGTTLPDGTIDGDNGDIVLEPDTETNTTNTDNTTDTTTTDTNTPTCYDGKVFDTNLNRCVCPSGYKEIVISTEPAYLTRCHKIQDVGFTNLTDAQKWTIIILGTAAMYYVLYKVDAFK